MWTCLNNGYTCPHTRTSDTGTCLYAHPNLRDCAGVDTVRRDAHTVSFVTNSQIISSESPQSIVTFAPSPYQTEDSVVVTLSTNFSVIKSVDIFAVCCINDWSNISCLTEPSLVNSVDVCVIY